MHVGMNRMRAKLKIEETGVPHARGDEPLWVSYSRLPDESSPCTWG